MESFRKYLAEFIGTAFLVIFGCGTAAITGCSSHSTPAYLITALAFGLVLMALVYAIGSVSGCHVNPAVSLAMLIRGDIRFGDFLGYIVAQFAGGIAGAGILVLLNVKKNLNTLGANAIFGSGSAKSYIATIAIEAMLTFLFVFVILRVTRSKSNSAVAGVVIGLTLTLVHIFGIYFTGTSVNPARSFGPALLMGGDALNQVWVFIVAPLIGGALAALADRFFAGKEE